MNGQEKYRQAHVVTKLALPALLAAVPAMGAVGGDVSDMRLRLDEQQAVIEAQQRQLAAQDVRLREQERLLNLLLERSSLRAGTDATATSQPVPASATSAHVTPQSAAAPTASPAGISARFAGVDVTVGGALRTTVTTTTARMQPDATPFLVLPPTPGLPDGTTKFDARLSSLVVSLEGGTLGEFKLGGLVYAYLFDGNLFSGQYGVYPGIAYLDATSERWRFAAGLQQDVFSPMIPTMVDRMSAFAGSGNAGNSFKTQLRAERYFRRGSDTITVQAALADALPSNIEPGFAGTTENAGVPNVEARIAWTHGDGNDALLKWPTWTIGLSAATGQFRTFYDTDPDLEGAQLRSYQTTLSGVAVEGGMRIGDRFGLQGEYYRGRALGPYLGAIFQTTSAANREALESNGVWAEAAWYWAPGLHSHLGYGHDAIERQSLAAIRSNETAFANFFWDPSAMTTLGIEATWRRTEYFGGIDNDGFALMLSSELRF